MSVDLLHRTIEALDAAGVPHMLAGSFASNEYGELRSTQDIDIVIDPGPDELDRFLDSIDSNAYYVDRITAHEELTRRGMFNVIDLRLGWKVDLIMRKDRPFSTTEFERRVRTTAFGVPLWIATAEDVVLSKLEWAQRGGSDRQIGDAAAVLRVRGNDLDDAYLRHWAAELGVIAELQRARALATGSAGT